MTNNDILRRMRYALHLNNQAIIRLFTLGGHPLGAEDLNIFLKDDEDPDFIECPDILFSAFLNGLILDRRGPRDSESGPEERLNNNLILRKIRIALELKDTDLVKILHVGGLEVSKTELSALFRKPGHRNFMRCKDQFLRKFLTGLAASTREDLS